MRLLVNSNHTSACQIAAHAQLLFARVKFTAPRTQRSALHDILILSHLLIVRRFKILLNFHELLSISNGNTCFSGAAKIVGEAITLPFPRPLEAVL